MAVKAVVLLGICALLTWRQVPVWASDEALWRAAVGVNHTSPRPALNLAIALRSKGDYDGMTRWLDETARRAEGHRDQAWYRRGIQVQYEVVELLGVFLCESPTRPRSCSS